MVTIYVFTYNEEIMIEFFIQHYQKMFPNCVIHLYDNYSTDNTVEIAKRYNCIIEYNDTNNQHSDSKLLYLKNNVWKTAPTDWVIVVDCDELIQINENDLIIEQNNGTTIIQFDGFQMFNNELQTFELNNIIYGFPDKLYSKKTLFNKTKINNINYSPGCHNANPTGTIKYNENKYNLLHYKYLSVDYLANRYKLIQSRQSEENLKKGYGKQYKKTEEQIKKDFSTFSKVNLTKLL